ncbi:hypothetical protein CYME_CMK013C [Cyanidioschyzon merolae strain 10D]|uniref:Uncharacterized protein n=1 Tax=Cyanidioschyzon merolae (strain NIES-3377 / 10D) TaxID=280699 RepID=M1V888_CYAM1|nr:hypothetical protein CYME_CMK013C [Cyanidioschyzon merolae strain 10D]BAM80414.1 hypothetical protein CYME_CMK013C [Cyanidioschyzon merolae strain 10D]|eukprot:XP_005536450.1 hypothetical protein CYME_CMK013C [Cyanidioschyzon merolae strain 10D]
MVADTETRPPFDSVGPRPLPSSRIRTEALPRWASPFDKSACQSDVARVHRQLNAEGWALGSLLGTREIPKESGVHLPSDRKRWLNVVTPGTSARSDAHSGDAATDPKVPVVLESEHAANVAVQGDVDTVTKHLAVLGSELVEDVPDGTVVHVDQPAPLDEAGASKVPAEASPIRDQITTEPRLSVVDATAPEQTESPRADASASSPDTESSGQHPSREEPCLGSASSARATQIPESVLVDEAKRSQGGTCEPMFQNHSRFVDQPPADAWERCQARDALCRSVADDLKRELSCPYSPIGVDMQDLTWGFFTRMNRFQPARS